MWLQLTDDGSVLRSFLLSSDGGQGCGRSSQGLSAAAKVVVAVAEAVAAVATKVVALAEVLFASVVALAIKGLSAESRL